MYGNNATGNISPEFRICAGYLDRTLEVFESHMHLFVLVSTLAFGWSGIRTMPQDEIDILVHPEKLQVLVQDLIALGDWTLCENPIMSEPIPDTSMINTFPIRDMWLRSRIEDPWFHYLRLWPENLYSLSVDCPKIEIPDVMNKDAVLLEEEYYRDEHQRFGPPRGSTHSFLMLPMLQVRAKLRRTDIPIFVPTTEHHLNAPLDQARAEKDTKLASSNAPRIHIWNFVRYLFLDWAPNREWILANKIRERNRPLMRTLCEKFRRKQLILWDPVLKKSVFDKMPWELSHKVP